MEVENEYDDLVEDLSVAKEARDVIDVNIKKLQRKLLDTKEAQENILPIRNSGGERTVGRVTFEIKRNYVWDQDRISELVVAADELPPFVTMKLEYKIDMRKFKDWAVENPEQANPWHSAMAIKYGDPRVKSIKEE
jgi:hypothetical protein